MWNFRGKLSFLNLFTFPLGKFELIFQVFFELWPLEFRKIFHFQKKLSFQRTCAGEEILFSSFEEYFKGWKFRKNIFFVIYNFLNLTPFFVDFFNIFSIN